MEVSRNWATTAARGSTAGVNTASCVRRPPRPAARGPSVRARVPAGPDEILANVDLRDERGDPLRPDTSRRADDGTEIDRRCVGRRDPHARCAGRGRREVASPLAPPCSDHNRTVDALLGCADAGGERAGTCLQIAYTQTTFVHVCGGEFADDGDCGTFVEVHRPNGSPYDGKRWRWRGRRGSSTEPYAHTTSAQFRPPHRRENDSRVHKNPVTHGQRHDCY